MSWQPVFTIQVRHQLTAAEIVTALAKALCAGYGHSGMNTKAKVQAALRGYLEDNGKPLPMRRDALIDEVGEDDVDLGLEAAKLVGVDTAKVFADD